jgi:hypothetical protein
MSAWTNAELDKIAAANGLELTPAGADGRLRKPVRLDRSARRRHLCLLLRRGAQGAGLDREQASLRSSRLEDCAG